MKEPVHVICAANTNFIMPLSVMLVSLVRNFDPNRELHVHVISPDATEQDRDKVRDSIAMNRPGLERITLHWHAINQSLLADFHVPSRSHFSADTYSRILAPQLLPESCGRAVYLDCDMVVLADIAALFDSLTGKSQTILATQDHIVPLVSSPRGVFDYEARKIPPTALYFNAGVMVINLQRWREKRLTGLLVRYLQEAGDRVWFVDQGALNAVLHDDWAVLDSRWNQISDILHYKQWAGAGYTRDQWLRARNDPYIVHYSGGEKPWHQSCRLPRYSYFFRYLKHTVYKDSLPGHPVLEEILGVRAYYWIWKSCWMALHLIRKRSGYYARNSA